VAITSSGFSPAAVSVAEGDAVRFTNQLGSSTRVHFLNLGPDGAAYSPSIAAGASWSYVAPGPRSILIEAEGATGRPGQIQVTFS
jgi:plastocyanin